MTTLETLNEVHPGMPLLVGGNKVVRLSAELAARFRPGDALFVVADSGEVLWVPAAQKQIAEAAVTRASRAFEQMGQVSDAQITRFFQQFAANLEDKAVWRQVVEQNAADVAEASARGRSTTRLVASDKLREGMIEGLLSWSRASSRRGQLLERVEHEGWVADLVAAELGVVGFVFEGRPNVLADATGVVRGGNTVVFRIGRDALRTARCIMQRALEPALEDAGLPEGTCVLVDSAEHAAGWALFSDRRLALAVARGSGAAVAALGSLAQQAGVPVSLHGTGGAWLFGSSAANPTAFASAVEASLDRKVCNTLNTCCVPRKAQEQLIPALISALTRAGDRLGFGYRLHVVRGDESAVPAELWSRKVTVRRAHGDFEEPLVDAVAEADLGLEWEWERTPEVTLKLVDDLAQAVSLFNRYSPRFVACLVSDDAEEQRWFFDRVNAPFVGDGDTRWVDGQYALKRPELGLSNWQNGRLLGRGAILSGDSVFTVRTRVQTHPGHAIARRR